MDLKLVTIEQDEKGTFSMLHVPRRGALYTVERPWVPEHEGVQYPYGAPGISCVPAGEYHLVKAHSPSRRQDMYYLVGDGVDLRQTDPPRRWGAMFHIANYPHDVEGCLGLGMSLWPGEAQTMVRQSGLAFTQLMGWLDAADGVHRLSIVRPT